VIVNELLAAGLRINIKQAGVLRDESKQKKLTKTAVKKLLEPVSSPANAKSVKLSGELWSQYFGEGQSEEDIERVIAEALEQYHSSRDNG
jgi:hypothetical protein